MIGENMKKDRNIEKTTIIQDFIKCKKVFLEESEIQKTTEFINLHLKKELDYRTKSIIHTIEIKQDEVIQLLTELIQKKEITKKDREILTQKIEDESNQCIEYILHKKGKILHQQVTKEEWESILSDIKRSKEILFVVHRIFDSFVTAKNELDAKFLLLLEDIRYSNKQFSDNEERLYFKRRMEGVYNSYAQFILDEFFTIESRIFYSKVSFDEFLPESKPNKKPVNLDDIYGEEE